jgi:hypothetical protein
MTRPAALLFMLILVTALHSTNAGRQPLNFTAAPGSPFSVGQGLSDVDVIDANGDGSLDLIAATAGDRGVRVLLGDGRGSFRPGPGRPPSSDAAPHLLAAADFNLDKKIDVATSGHDSNGVTVLFGDGAGAFTAAAGSPLRH